MLILLIRGPHTDTTTVSFHPSSLIPQFLHQLPENINTYLPELL